jgi:hypothetical protein
VNEQQQQGSAVYGGVEEYVKRATTVSAFLAPKIGEYVEDEERYWKANHAAAVVGRWAVVAFEEHSHNAYGSNNEGATGNSSSNSSGNNSNSNGGSGDKSGDAGAAQTDRTNGNGGGSGQSGVKGGGGAGADEGGGGKHVASPRYVPYTLICECTHALKHIYICAHWRILNTSS